MQHPEVQIPMSQPHPTPQKHHSPNANPNVTVQTCGSHKTRRLRSEIFLHTSTSYVSARFLESDTSRFQAPLQNLPALYRSIADGCERLTTVAIAQTTSREQGSTPRPPELNENPSLRIREKGTTCENGFGRTCRTKSHLQHAQHCLLKGINMACHVQYDKGMQKHYAFAQCCLLRRVWKKAQTRCKSATPGKTASR